MPNFTFILFLVPMFAMMYFMQRQQKKRAQELQNQIMSLTKGDEVVTIGGLYGLVDELDGANNKIVLDVDGVYLTFELYAIKRVVNKVAGQDVVVEETAVIEE